MYNPVFSNWSYRLVDDGSVFHEAGDQTEMEHSALLADYRIKVKDEQDGVGGTMATGGMSSTCGKS